MPAIGYITPRDMLAGRQQEIHAERGRKLGGAEATANSPASKPLDVQLMSVGRGSG